MTEGTYLVGDGPGRWRLLAELPVFVFGLAIVLALAVGVPDFLGLAKADGSGALANPLADFFFWFAVIACLPLPLAFALRVVNHRRLGGLSSVEGHIRWRWLWSCVPAAVAFASVTVLADAFVSPDEGTGGDWPGVGTYTTVLTSAFLVVPLQAAAEEYVFRGWAIQVLAPWLKRRWTAATTASILFVLAHGTTDPGRIVDLAALALALCWLTFRTGGIEAAIVFHAALNATILLVAGTSGVVGIEEVDADDTTPLGAAAISAVITLIYVLAVAQLWDRRSRNRQTPGPA